MRTAHGMAVVGLALGLATSPAAAQLSSNPVYFSPPSGPGFTLAGDVGRGLNDNSGKNTHFGGRAELGLPMLTVGVGAGVLRPNGGGDSEVQFAGNAAVKIFSLPLTGVSVSVHAGAGYLKTGTGATETKAINVPAGLTVGIKPPTPGVSFEPWASARIHYMRETVGTLPADSDTRFGASAGLNLGLPMGLGFHAAVDYINVPNAAPIVAGAGVHYKFTIPGLGMVPGM